MDGEGDIITFSVVGGVSEGLHQAQGLILVQSAASQSWALRVAAVFTLRPTDCMQKVGFCAKTVNRPARSGSSAPAGTNSLG